MVYIYKRTILVVIIISLLLPGVAFAENIISRNLTESREIKNSYSGQFSDLLFDQKISFLMRIAGYPSLSACIIKDDQIILSKSYGYYDLSEKKPATSDTIYLLASITKTIVGTALMQLYEQDLFDLDDDVNMFLPFELRNPNFPDDPITFRMLLSHRSSLNTNRGNRYYWFNFSGDPPFDFSPEPYLQEYLLPDGAYYTSRVWSEVYRPGQHAMYANVGFELIAYLVEIISGECFLEYCDNNIFIPLGMKNTSFNLSRLNIDQVAIPYQRVLGKYYYLDEYFTKLIGYNNTYQYWRIRWYPGAGLYSTVSDISRFLIAHMNDGVYQDVQIIEKDTVDIMQEFQQYNNIRFAGYSLAWMHRPVIGYGHVVSGHSGSYPGVSTCMFYDKTENIGVIYLANGNPTFSFFPPRGFCIYEFILRSFFTKERSLLSSAAI